MVPTTIEDRWLWLGLGVFTFVAAKAVAYGLRNIVQLTEVHKPPPRPTIPLPDKEDAIKTSSLQTLATCSNVEIRKAATKILCQRFVHHPSAYKMLVKDLTSDNPDTQHRAQLALDILSDFDTLRSREVAPRSIPTRLVPSMRPSTARDTGNRDPEERDLRRRRREAVVLNEGDRPVSQEDVWMRDEEGRMSTEETLRPRGTLEVLTGEQEDREFRYEHHFSPGRLPTQNMEVLRHA
ncbi:hypothetical protein K458DRAFT_341467 [Lentithecium fluviatile CBS 122367]|uniref:Uncharacterized protein n=1 Tax=Lentithecium fluviatile CBS 122367 TaxID=1168545 RepID=A0A6G1IWS9_9PLEO|nr:hypothetical protein K458DRAFT_341467 [Lentithecium fluviatile CBS 122367]